MEEHYGKHSVTSPRRLSLLPLSNDQGDGYLPAFSRPRSAIPFSSTSCRPLSPTSPHSRNRSYKKEKLEDGPVDQPSGSPRRWSSTLQSRPSSSVLRQEENAGGRKVSRTGGAGEVEKTLDRVNAGGRQTASGRSRSKSVGRKTSSSDSSGIGKEQTQSKDEGGKKRPGTPLVKTERVRKSSNLSRPTKGLSRRKTTLAVTSTGVPTSKGKPRRESAPAAVGKANSSGLVSQNQVLDTVSEAQCTGRATPSSRRSSVSTTLSRSSSRLHVGADSAASAGIDNPSTGVSLQMVTTKKRGATMGTLMNVLQFRRKTMRSRHHRSGNAIPPGEHLDEKEELELLEGDPLSVNAETNRFTLSLSPEAQFAMLKGYEDRLQRALAPSEYCAKTENENEVEDGDAAREGEHPMTSEVECLNAFQDLSKASDATQYRTKMNWKLENAMDIIDCMRNNRGHHVTSDRFRSKVSDPVRHFRRWNRACDHDLAMARVKLQIVPEGSS